MPHSRCCAVFVVFSMTMIGWPCLNLGHASAVRSDSIPPSQTVELLDAIQHPPPYNMVILTHPYAGTLKTVYSRTDQDDNEKKPERIIYNILLNNDAHPPLKKTDLPKDWTPEQVKDYLYYLDNGPHGIELAAAEKISSNLDNVSYTMPTIFQTNLPTVTELISYTKYAQFEKNLLGKHGPTIDFWIGPDGKHESIGWLCFTPGKGKTIRVVDVSCDVVFPFSKSDPPFPFINSTVIKKGLFQPVDSPSIRFIIIKEGLFHPIDSPSIR